MFGKNNRPQYTPVFVINGFLESGKTEFINYTLAQPYFKAPGRTLLIVCEEGEIEYDEELLKKTKTDMVLIEEVEEFTPAKCMELISKYKSERVIIEWNGMWDYRNIRLPHSWKLEQQITVIDGSTFNSYFNNMRSLLAEMIKGSELVIMNRCDDVVDELPTYRRNIKIVAQNADVVFEGKEGEISQIFEEDLPYDLSADTIKLDDESFILWFMDMHDHLERYVGKKVCYTAMVYKAKDMPEDFFVPGRMAMTCCADDVQFIGFPCKYDDAKTLKNQQWIEITAEVLVAPKGFYEDGDGPMLKALSVKETSKPKNEVVGF